MPWNTFANRAGGGSFGNARPSGGPSAPHRRAAPYALEIEVGVRLISGAAVRACHARVGLFSMPVFSMSQGHGGVSNVWATAAGVAWSLSPRDIEVDIG